MFGVRVASYYLPFDAGDRSRLNIDFIFKNDLLRVTTTNEKWDGIVIFAAGNGLSKGSGGPAEKLVSSGRGQWRLDDEEDVTLQLLKRG